MPSDPHSNPTDSPGAKPSREQTARLSRGEARIRRAFILSSVVIAGAVLIGGLGWLLLQRPAPETRVEEASLPTPMPAQPPAGDVGAASPPAVRFTDITEVAGIGFVHVNGAYGERLMPETIGSGAAFFDYDRDGDQDLFLVNSRRWPDRDEGEIGRAHV